MCCCCIAFLVGPDLIFPSFFLRKGGGKENKKEEKIMAEYERCLRFDIITPIRELLRQGQLWINKDKLIEFKMTVFYDSPWIHVNPALDRKCGLWSRIMFNRYKIIPKGCMQCWKLSAHPGNLDEAFKMLELQKRLGLASKTGMELRDYSGNLDGWTSIWHCPLGCGLKKAREQHSLVEKAIQEKFGMDAPELVLKRGCTEMEKGIGASDKWETTATWEFKEKLIEAVFIPWPDASPPQYLEPYIKKKWIERAASCGDSTYLKHCEKPIISPLVFYHESDHKNEDFEPLKEIGEGP